MFDICVSTDQFAYSLSGPIRSRRWTLFTLILFAATLATTCERSAIAQDNDQFRRVETPDDWQNDEVLTCDFERDSKGNELTKGTDVSNAYRSIGLLIAATEMGQTPIVESYKVRSGHSAANGSANDHYKGNNEFTFCVPGKPKMSASITKFGLYVSYVTPDGTKLQAFDSDGNLVGEIATTKSGSDFLGFESKVPITKVRLVAVVDIDPDYAFDDVQFDLPQNRD